MVPSLFGLVWGKPADRTSEQDKQTDHTLSHRLLKEWKDIFR